MKIKSVKVKINQNWEFDGGFGSLIQGETFKVKEITKNDYGWRLAVLVGKNGFIKKMQLSHDGYPAFPEFWTFKEGI